MDKLIIVVYINVDGVPPENIDEYCTVVLTQIKDEDIMHYIIPVRNQETKVECINPKIVTEEGYIQAKKALDSIVGLLKELNNGEEESN